MKKMAHEFYIVHHVATYTVGYTYIRSKGEKIFVCLYDPEPNHIRGYLVKNFLFVSIQPGILKVL